MDHVLIADDDADIRSVTHMILTGAGYTGSEAADGDATFRLLQTAPSPGVILLDLGLPHLDTDASRKRITYTQMHHHAYVRFTSQPPQTYTPLLPLIEQFALRLLVKPFVIDDLLTTVARSAVYLPVVVATPLSVQPH